MVETADPVAVARSVAVFPSCARYSASVMTICLRHTQTEVNSVFASHALRTVCASCKIDRMKVRLGEIRGERNLEDIAHEIDVAISTVQRWEKGSMAIPSFRLPAIARAYGCSIHDIFDAEEDPPSETSEVINIWSRIPVDRRDEVKELLSVIAKRQA